jgi:hypothetical protein
MGALRVVAGFLWEVGELLVKTLQKLIPSIWKTTKYSLLLMWNVLLVMGTSLVGEVENMSQAIEYRMVDQIPITLHKYLHQMAKALAGMIVLVTWIGLSYTTVWIIETILKVAK